MTTDGLPPYVRALYRLITSNPPRATPDATTRPLLDAGLPADLHAIVHAWTYFGRPSGGQLRDWNIFEVWDFKLAVAPVSAAEVRRVCGVLAPGSRTDFPEGPYVQLGWDAGGTTVFAGVTNGETVCFGPERGEDWDGIDGFLSSVEARAGSEVEPALEPFLD